MRHIETSRKSSRKTHEDIEKADSVSFEKVYEFDTDTIIDIARVLICCDVIDFSK